MKNDIFDISIIPNYVFEDERLSIKDWGMLSYLIHLDLTKKVSVLEMIKKFKQDGKDSIRASIKHLEETGYLVRDKNNWSLNLHYDEASVVLNSKILLRFKIDPVAKTQNWTNDELLLLRPAMLQLEEQYEYPIIFCSFKYVINRLAQYEVNDRVAYVIKSMRDGCRRLYLNNCSEEELKEIMPDYETMEEILARISKVNRND